MSITIGLHRKKCQSSSLGKAVKLFDENEEKL